MANHLYLGIDTSSYTASVAVLDGAGALLWDRRRVLAVAQGEKGLRQSEAVFQHIKSLPGLIPDHHMLQHVVRMAASVRPRNVSGSYMPVFLAGTGYARVMSQSLDVPLLECSHQEGHIAAGLWSANWQPQHPFLAVHLSGGTTEILDVKWGIRPEIEVIGATRDINAGQLVDRVGVALGLKFPAGPQLEQLAASSRGQLRLPCWSQGCDMSFSGPLTAALRMIGSESGAEIARAAENCVAETLSRAIICARERTGYNQLLLVGGVIANSRIRQVLQQRLATSPVGLQLHFASRQAAADNAIGLAALARQADCV